MHINEELDLCLSAYTEYGLKYIINAECDKKNPYSGILSICVPDVDFRGL